MPAIIHTLLSDTALQNEFLRCLKIRKIEQKHFYQGEGAEMYYRSDIDSHRYASLPSMERIPFSFLEKHFSDNKKAVIISLACGKGYPEKIYLKRLLQQGFQFEYIGVDASLAMIRLAEAELGNLEMSTSFIQADIMQTDWIDDLRRQIAEYPTRLFMLVGGTFCNFVSTEIIDTLVNLLQKNDLLWFDTPVQEDQFFQTTIGEIFLYRKQRLKVPNKVHFYFHPLSRVGMSISCGHVGFEVEEEDPLRTLNLKHFFWVQEKAFFSYCGQDMVALPGERFELMNIRLFQSKRLMESFQLHGFEFLTSHQTNGIKNFLFQRI